MRKIKDECRVIFKELEIISSTLLEVNELCKECREIEILRKIVQGNSETVSLLYTTST